MKTEPGKPYPLGATCTAEGVNFSVYSRSAHLLELLLFDRADADQPAERIALHREFHRTGDYWHVFIPGLKPGQLYGYHAHGNFHPEQGKRFDGEKVLLDPYTRAVWGQKNYRRPDAQKSGTNYPTSLKSVVTDTQSYDWEGDQPLRRRGGKTVIYEMHVRGFTRDPSSGLNEQVRGTYRGIIEKIPYLKDLGVTAVELMPVHEFDPQDAPAGKSNYWGYSPIAFFAPHSGYSNAASPLGVLDDFRDMVKALHHADIEVIVDVVLNHTGEVDEKGPTLSMRGLENEVYYILDRTNLARYTNYAGCGNVINSNHSVVRRLIRDCLRYWVREMHVDGFRFDLASIFSRGEDGKVMANPPVIWTIDSDPVLAGSRIIAEAWDAGGLYQVGRFAGERFQEWNGPFRDEVRRFVKGDTHT
ncbi:MAG TPA: alpha-amylase family glycosyl hydrolase, partial [Calditrichia bacterium]|nr:alpha-amylase family glycosyl hydrolase [Calditrichia bacterium]